MVSGLAHTALLYDDRDALTDQLAATIRADLDADGAVLLAVHDDLAAPVLAGVGPRRDRVQHMPQHDRYARPATALDALWRFTTTSLGAGRAFVHSIGEIGFTGTESDDDWHWYEAGVNHVFDGMALRATCLYATADLSIDVVAHARTTHPSVCEHATTAPSPSFRPDHVPTRSPLGVPRRTPDVGLASVTASGEARAALRVHASRLRPDVLDRAVIVVSELVTNAALHGGGTAAVDIWVDAPAITIRVRDDGPGIGDPFASLRPPALPTRGAGLWICHQESTHFVVDPGERRGTTAVAVIA